LEQLSPGKSGEPSGAIAETQNKKFGNFSESKERNNTELDVFSNG